jgi:hypothetical protein
MGMETDTRKFFIRIVNTIAMVLLWMMLQVFAGIYLGLAFFEGRPVWHNILYFIFFILTLLLLIRYVSRKWKGIDM